MFIGKTGNREAAPALCPRWAQRKSSRASYSDSAQEKERKRQQIENKALGKSEKRKVQLGSEQKIEREYI